MNKILNATKNNLRVDMINFKPGDTVSLGVKVQKVIEVEFNYLMVL